MPNERRTYAFGPFELDPADRVLRQGGALVPITPKAVDTLLVLCEHHGRVVSKDVLMQSVWPDTTVEEGNLTQNIYLLRKALGARSDCGIAIETVPRRGYRLVGDMTFAPARAADALAAGAAEPAHSQAPLGDVDPPPAVPPNPSRQPTSRLPWVVAAAVLVGAGIAGVTGSRPTTNDAVTPVSWMSAAAVRPLSSLPGEKQHPSLSPAGDRVAFVWDRGDGHNIYVTPADADQVTQVSHGPGAASFPGWAPDGAHLAFIRRSIDDAGGRFAGVFIVPATGGPERQIWRGEPSLVGDGLDWAADGASLLMSLRPARGAPFRIAALTLATGATRWLTTTADGVGDQYPVYAPDGKRFAFVRYGETSTQLHLQTADGQASRALPIEGHLIQRLAWQADGAALVFASRHSRRMWVVPVAGGAPVPLDGLGQQTDEPSMARQAMGRIVFRQSRQDQNLYRLDLVAPGTTPGPPLAPTSGHDAQPSVSPDGRRLAFITSRSGFDELWIMQVDGTRPTQVTSFRTGVRQPRWSPDGRSIAFSAYVAGSRASAIHVTDVATGQTRRVAAGPGVNTWPFWSHRADWVYFTSNRSGEWTIWKVPAAGGEAVRVSDGGVPRAEESADGRFLYYAASAVLWRRPQSGGAATQVLRFPPQTAWGGEWRLAARGVYWLNEQDRGRPVLEFFDFAAGASRRVAPLEKYDDGGGFSLAPDERWLVYGRRDYSASELMIADAPGRAALSPAR